MNAQYADTLDDDPFDHPFDVVELVGQSLRKRGRPVVFIHGFSHNRHVWASVANSLSPALRPISLDLRGHGDSDWSVGGRYALDDYARDLPSTLDAMRLDRILLVAHSLGGHAATLFAAAHPERVEALVLVDTGPSLSIGALSKIASDTDTALGSFESVEIYRRWLAAMLPLAEAEALANFASKSLVRRLDGRYEVKLDPGVTLPSEDVGEWRTVESRLRHALTKITCPTLLVRGGLSAVLPEAVADEIVDTLLPDGRLITLDKAGHAIMLEQGPQLCRVIEDFFDGLAAHMD